MARPILHPPKYLPPYMRKCSSVQSIFICQLPAVIGAKNSLFLFAMISGQFGSRRQINECAAGRRQKKKLNKMVVVGEVFP